MDWYGSQGGQGQFQGQKAEGTPLAWTTNSPGAAGHQDLNVLVIIFLLIGIRDDKNLLEMYIYFQFVFLIIFSIGKMIFIDMVNITGWLIWIWIVLKPKMVGSR